MATAEHEASLRWLLRLRRIYHVCFVATLASAVGLCRAGAGGSGPPHAGFLAAIFLSFGIGLVAQSLVWRTRCPKCQQRFFRRTWSPHHTWAGFPTDENCGQCRFNLYRGDNIERSA